MFELPIEEAEVPVADESQFTPFEAVIQGGGLDLSPTAVETLQVNVTKLCNQACHHCHVDASPKRTEQMDERTINRCLEVMAENPDIKNLDITGGAPELNPHFDYFVEEAKKLGKHIMVRHNLTVTFDGNPQTKESKRYLPEFFAKHGIEVVSSLPYYQEFFTDKQRGKGVFQKSMDSMKLLNEQGYGEENSGLVLDLVYNPIGAFLPPEQEHLEADYKKELWEKFGLKFNNLYTITNMPIHRFKEQLLRKGGYEEYMEKLVNAFNPAAALGVMCRSLVSVGYDGTMYDCDFNQMLDMAIEDGGQTTIFDFDYSKLINREIKFDLHCYGCTAGSGSSCGGATA
ncbi:MAG: radical SAM protein [Ectothiorhodospiraceae bacterium]|nr:radical SAM protein [Ectothiorhodospiraceae bacterium]